MKEDIFFDNLQMHFDDALPFVVYRKPNEQLITALLQEDDTLHEVVDFKESGFVFAPFDNDQARTVLIPSEQSHQMVLDQLSVVTTRSEVPEIPLDEQNRRQHVKIVQKGIDAIKSGEMRKVVLSRKQNITHSYESPFNIFKRLSSRYPTAFVYCWYHPKVGLWFGATPETLLSVHNRKLHTMSLAGTQKFNGTTEVSWGVKEQEEQQLVTDSIVENLEPLVTNLDISNVQTHKAGSLLHLKTEITATINEAEVALSKILKALHPTPAVCGLPKNTAKDFISANEGYNRNYYTGFLGELNIKTKKKRARSTRNTENLAYGMITRHTHLFVNLRCMEIDAGGAQLYVGGGVTGSSIPEAEWEETVHKLSTMINAFK